MAHPAERTAEFPAQTAAALLPHPAASDAGPPPAARDAALVDLLRELAIDSRLARRLDLDRACALIASEPGDAVRRYGVALLSALSEGARLRLVFHPRGSGELTFAERWLSGLVGSLARGDEDSARFAVERVVDARHRRSVRFLALGFAGAWQAYAGG